MQALAKLVMAAGLVLLLGPAAQGAEFHTATNGRATGDGSQQAPWDLATALAGPSQVKPGDTIWLHEGTYPGGCVSDLKGEPGKPIVVRAARGARVIIDTRPRDERDNGLFVLGGADTIYRDFEVTCSDPKRETSISGSWPADIRRGSVDIRGDRIAAVNLVVHDQAGGFGFWSDGEGGEIYGCLIYNNGWQGPDRAHGHGIYAQNARGTKRIADNVVFHQFAYGIHAYGSEKASLKGLLIEGNIAFENGAAAKGGERSSGIMVGGGCPAERITIRNNVVVGGNIRLGYSWGATNEDAVVTGNYSDGGFVLRDFRKATVRKNTFIAGSNVVQLEGAQRLLTAGLDWDANDYYLTDGRWGECAIVEESKSRGVTFDQWRAQTGVDAKTTFTKGKPSQLRIQVRQNAYEAGRAHIAVVNPEGLPEVDVDLSGVLKSAQKYRVVGVKDVFGAAVLEGTYDGRPIRLPLKAIQAAAPVGLPKAVLPVTEPHFAAFLVLPSG